MKVIKGIGLIHRFRKPVVALGVFDGVHIGHAAILKETVKKARSINGTSVVVTFWPHPQAEESLSSLEHRLRLIAQLGIDACIVINFTPAFCAMSAEDFVKDILVDKTGAKFIYVGRNFRFGRHARADINTLSKLSRKYKLRIKSFGVISFNHQPISSTYIRALIRRGHLKLAEKLLGRPVSILGTVIRGKFLATRLGFPTANIDPHHEVIPPSGVYAVKVILGKRKLSGVCYIGTRPTVELKRRKAGMHVEAHIFNFSRKIYGDYLEIQFIRKLRDDRKFPSKQSLASQIGRDVLRAKKILTLPKSVHYI